MTKTKSNRYAHIKSFEDFDQEKMKLYFQIKYSEKKLQLKYYELGGLLNPIRLIPMLIGEWLQPLIQTVKQFVFNWFTGRRSSGSATSEE